MRISLRVRSIAQAEATARIRRISRSHALHRFAVLLMTLTAVNAEFARNDVQCTDKQHAFRFLLAFVDDLASDRDCAAVP
jgi:hypothetical protein